MKSLFNIKSLAAAMGMASISMMNACTPDSAYINNGLQSALQPTFTIVPLQNKPNYYLATNTTTGCMQTRWDFGQGAGYGAGREVDTVFYPDAGDYTVSMKAMGKGGVLYEAAPVNLNVPLSDPKAGNLVVGGKFNEDDAGKWTTITISGGVSFAMSGGKMVATGGGWGHAAIYQAIHVEANKKYRLGMTVSGSGASDTWFEVYLGSVEPSQGKDYSDGGNLMGLNTWAGCGNSAFSGNLASIACSGALVGKNGEISFAQSGTVYLVIKTGGGNLGTSGIAVDNVEFRGS